MPAPNDAIGSNRGSFGVDTRRPGAAVSRDCGMLGIGAAYGDSGAAGVGPLPEPFANGGGNVDPFDGPCDGPFDGPCDAALPFAPAADSQPFAVLTSDDRSGPVPVNVAAGDAASSGTGV